MDLSQMLVKSKTVDMEYPGYSDLVVKVAYLTREELSDLRKKCVNTKFNKRTRQPEEEVDSDLFQDLYIKAVIKGWEGFKYKYLEKMLPVSIPATEYKEGDGLFEFSNDNAAVLMKNCTDFDNWITAQLDDVENFTQASLSA